MKRVITLLLALVMVIGLTGCGGNDTPVAEAPNATQPTANTPDAAPEAAGEEYLRLNWEYINSTKSGFQPPL